MNPHQQSSGNTNANHIPVYLANVRGLYSSSQLSELPKLQSGLSSGMLALTETHIDSTLPNSIFCQPGWCMHRRDRSRHGGGVALILKEELMWKKRPDLESKIYEDLWIEINIHCRIIIVGVIYRPPNQSSAELLDFLTSLEKSLSKALSPTTTLLLMGDFNAKSDQWSPECNSDQAGILLSTLLNSFSLSQLVSEITRPHGGQGLPGTAGGSLLDLIITNSPDYFSAPLVGPPLGTSDHFSVSTTLNMKPPVQQRPLRRIWNISKSDQLSFLCDLANQPWPGQDFPGNLNHHWDLWLTLFLSTARRNVPSKVVRHVKPKPPWLSDLLLSECKLKAQLFRLCKHVPTPENIAKFRCQRNKVTALLRRAKAKFSSKLVSSAGMTSAKKSPNFWSFVRHCKGSKNSRPIPTIQVPNGSPAETDYAKANALNDFFIKQTDIPGRNDPPSALSSPTPCPNHLSSISVSAEDVYKQLVQLKSDKSPGLDNLPNNLLRFAAPAIAPSLAVLFTRSLDSGEIPLAWKTSKIRPIFKRGRTDLPENYRPISLLPAVAKVFESIVNSSLFLHLSDNQLLSPYQSGFRRGDSSSLQLFRLMQQAMSAVDDGKVVAAVFYDIRKAFDSVWHLGLLQKLSDSGIQGSLLKWFGDYLTSRLQYVEVGTTLSLPKTPLAGVPQGSVLGPTLFLLYINSVISVTSSPSNCFADDISTFVFSDSLPQAEIALQSDINSVLAWVKVHKLSLHPKKTVCMCFHNPHTKAPLLSVSLDGQSIFQCSTNCHLGLMLSSSFSWIPLVESLIRKTSSMIAVLRHFRTHYSFSKRNLLCIYRSFIRPVLEYGSIAWCGLSPTCSRRLEAIQQKALSICDLATDSLPALSFRRTNTLIALSARLLSNSDIPMHLSGFCSWPTVESASGRCLRNASTIRLPRPKSSVLKSSPLYVAMSAYNLSLSSSL